VKRLLVLVLLLLLAAVAAGAGFLLLLKPAQRPTTDLKIEATPERLARGEYLVKHVVGCFACHTETDRSKRTLPFIGPLGAGGECFTEEMGFPGHVCAPNITPDPETGIGAWTDDEVLRAVREGVNRDGETLFPMMLYPYYRNLPDDDAYAVVAYIRSIPAARKAYEPARVNFPVNMLIRMEPQPIESPVQPVDKSDPVQYGEYLTKVAACKECHGADLSGGTEFPTEHGIVRPSNLTPGADIVPADVEDFLRIFRAYQGGNLPEGVTDRDYTIMPWVAYSGMEEADLRAIHAYLRSLPPVKKEVQTYGEAHSD